MQPESTQLDRSVYDELLSVIDHQQSLHLGTCSTQGQPHTSYSPYIRNDHSFFVLTSEIAEHGKNLRASIWPQ